MITELKQIAPPPADDYSAHGNGQAPANVTQTQWSGNKTIRRGNPGQPRNNRRGNPGQPRNNRRGNRSTVHPGQPRVNRRANILRVNPKAVSRFDVSRDHLKIADVMLSSEQKGLALTRDDTVKVVITGRNAWHEFSFNIPTVKWLKQTTTNL